MRDQAIDLDEKTAAAAERGGLVLAEAKAPLVLVTMEGGIDVAGQRRPLGSTIRLSPETAESACALHHAVRVEAEWLSRDCFPPPKAGQSLAEYLRSALDVLPLQQSREAPLAPATMPLLRQLQEAGLRALGVQPPPARDFCPAEFTPTALDAWDAANAVAARSRIPFPPECRGWGDPPAASGVIERGASLGMPTERGRRGVLAHYRNAALLAVLRGLREGELIVAAVDPADRSRRAMRLDPAWWSDDRMAFDFGENSLRPRAKDRLGREKLDAPKFCQLQVWCAKDAPNEAPEIGVAVSSAETAVQRHQGLNGADLEAAVVAEAIEHISSGFIIK